jgi:hypothetical protein
MAAMKAVFRGKRNLSGPEMSEVQKLFAEKKRNVLKDSLKWKGQQ